MRFDLCLSFFSSSCFLSWSTEALGGSGGLCTGGAGWSLAGCVAVLFGSGGSDVVVAARGGIGGSGWAAGSFAISSTKSAGNMPVLPLFLPRHQPSVSWMISTMSPGCRARSSSSTASKDCSARAMRFGFLGRRAGGGVRCSSTLLT
ncbi:hypothetical protein DL89DRAFT_167877 [Linderina pennispora]|uniref:Secreted protein n=1 Tax=Linderina pennispora TaxID=61395 RepID=A0A1Y1VUD9_9FUNG|nr:uncharacterized protein DL89DRAFT_167877 [Linderina pennispora]ORX64626.1 hypothetical protein DL89DRAFT_167877 [Linderina pennispora]